MYAIRSYYGENGCTGAECDTRYGSDVLWDLLHQLSESLFYPVLLRFQQFDLVQQATHFQLCGVGQKSYNFV